MSSRWFLPLLAVLALGALFWVLSPERRVSPQERLDSARARLAAKPADVPGALRDLDEALRHARGEEWGVLRAAILRERARVYAGRGLEELALVDCRAELQEFGPHADTLARAADMCLALGEPGLALEYARDLTTLAPARGESRMGRARLALADAPLSAIERLARTTLPVPDSAGAITLAQRAAVYAGESGRSAVALEDLLEHFPRSEDRRRVSEWVREASEHLELGAQAFVASLQGSTGEAVAGLQDLLLRGAAPDEAIDLGLVALSIPTLSSPMHVLARTAAALAELGRLETARALILDLRQRNPSALRPSELPSLAVRNELAEWCLLLERLALWDELRTAAWELVQRSREDRVLTQLGLFLFAGAELAQNRPGSAESLLANLGSNLVEEHDLGVRVWMLRAAVARRLGQRSQERYALLLATKSAPLDPRAQPLRGDLGRAWQRLYELQLEEGDLLAAEESLTHALRCSSERAAEVEPLWHELGQKALTTRGASSPYLLYARAKSQDERGEAAGALTDARALLEDFPGLGPALAVLSHAAYVQRDFPRMISASLELLERGWPTAGASARLRAVPKEFFLPQDRVRWMQLDPRGSLEEVVRLLLARGDLEGAALAARGGPPAGQPPELIPLLAEVQSRAGFVGPALRTLDVLPPDSAPFRSCAGQVLRTALTRSLQAGQGGVLATNLDKVLASGAPEDEGLLGALDVLLALGRRREADALLGWMEHAPFLGERLLRSAAARMLAGAAGAVDEDLERAAALLDDGRAELGRLILASLQDDGAALAREARALLGERSARPTDPAAAARRDALALLAGEPAPAGPASAAPPGDGRDFLAESTAAARAALDSAAVDSTGEPQLRGAFSPFLLASVPPTRLLLFALVSEQPPWSAWVLSATGSLPPALRADPWVRTVRAQSWLALSATDLALPELGPPSTDARLEWMRVRIARARGAPPAEVRAAELGWFAASGLAPGDEPELCLLAAEGLARAGEREGAARLLEGALEARPTETRLLAALAQLESVPGRRTRALELYVRLLGLLAVRSDEPEVLLFLDVLRAARDEQEISEARWWAEVEALEAERPQDPALPRELVARALERPAGSREQARTHALQRLERFRARSFGLGLERLRAGEATRWTELIARVSPERALVFAEEELLRDPNDPALWRATAQALLAAGSWKAALTRLAALQRLAPDRESGRLLALVSFRIERNPRLFATHLEEAERSDEQARLDPALAFYADLDAALRRKEAGGADQALALWQARASNGLAHAEHGRALALTLFQNARREPALEVLEETRPLVESRLERDVLAALAFLMRAAPATPRRLVEAPLPPRLEATMLDDEPEAARNAPAGRARNPARRPGGAAAPDGKKRR